MVYGVHASTPKKDIHIEKKQRLKIKAEEIRHALTVPLPDFEHINQLFIAAEQLTTTKEEKVDLLLLLREIQELSFKYINWNIESAWNVLHSLQGEKVQNDQEYFLQLLKAGAKSLGDAARVVSLPFIKDRELEIPGSAMQQARQWSDKIVADMNDVTKALASKVQDDPSLYDFFAKITDAWGDTYKVLLQARMVHGPSYHFQKEHLQQIVEIAAYQAAKACRNLENAVHENIELAWNAFRSMTRDKLKEGMPIAVIEANLIEKLSMFDKGLDFLKSTVNGIGYLIAQKDYFTGRTAEDKSKFGQSVDLLNESFRAIEEFIHELKHDIEIYNLPDYGRRTGSIFWPELHGKRLGVTTSLAGIERVLRRISVSQSTDNFLVQLLQTIIELVKKTETSLQHKPFRVELIKKAQKFQEVEDDIASGKKAFDLWIAGESSYDDGVGDLEKAVENLSKVTVDDWHLVGPFFLGKYRDELNYIVALVAQRFLSMYEELDEDGRSDLLETTIDHWRGVVEQLNRVFYQLNGAPLLPSDALLGALAKASEVSIDNPAEELIKNLARIPMCLLDDLILDIEVAQRSFLQMKQLHAFAEKKRYFGRGLMGLKAVIRSVNRLSADYGDEVRIEFLKQYKSSIDRIVLFVNRYFQQLYNQLKSSSDHKFDELIKLMDKWRDLVGKLNAAFSLQIDGSLSDIRNELHS